MLFVEGLIHEAKFKNMYKSGKRICTKYIYNFWKSVEGGQFDVPCFMISVDRAIQTPPLF